MRYTDGHKVLLNANTMEENMFAQVNNAWILRSKTARRVHHQDWNQTSKGDDKGMGNPCLMEGWKGDLDNAQRHKALQSHWISDTEVYRRQTSIYLVNSARTEHTQLHHQKTQSKVVLGMRSQVCAENSQDCWAGKAIWWREWWHTLVERHMERNEQCTPNFWSLGEGHLGITNTGISANHRSHYIWHQDGREFQEKSSFCGWWAQNQNSGGNVILFIHAQWRDSIQIALTITSLYGLVILACNIQNTYLMVDCRERV